MQSKINKMHNNEIDIKAGEIWRHYKGHDYRITAISCHTEDLSWYFVYEALYENSKSKIWHRPLEMFLGQVEADGVTIKRFKKRGQA
jgi:hypothetical protein